MAIHWSQLMKFVDDWFNSFCSSHSWVINLMSLRYFTVFNRVYIYCCTSCVCCQNTQIWYAFVVLNVLLFLLVHCNIICVMHSLTENAQTPYSATVVINEVKYGTGYASSKRAAKLEAGECDITWQSVSKCRWVCTVVKSLGSHSSEVVARDWPKFGKQRSSAEEFDRMFSSVRLSNMWLFGKSLASFVASRLWRFVLATDVNSPVAQPHIFKKPCLVY